MYQSNVTYNVICNLQEFYLTKQNSCKVFSSHEDQNYNDDLHYRIILENVTNSHGLQQTFRIMNCELWC